MGFVQIIKMTSSKFDELEAAHAEWLRDTEGQRTVTRELVCANRDKPGEYWIVVEFPSYDDAVAFYESGDYQALRGIRHRCADSTLAIMQGLPGS